METDLKVQVETEEGEIESEDEELYRPLERPEHDVTVSTTQLAQNSDPEDEVEESDEDSDSDSSVPKIKRTKKKLLKIRPIPVVQPKKRNNIWCSGVQEDVLTHKLIKCDVDQTIDRDRDVETYDYKPRLFPNEKKDNVRYNKRKHDGDRIKFVKKHVVQKVENKSLCRNILQLVTNENDSKEDLAKDIANKLCEEKEDLVLRVLQYAGKDIALEMFNKTREIEENGGLLIMNGTRRRTPGGVFFYLVRGNDKISRENINLIFAEDRKNSISERKKRAKQVRIANAMKLKKLLANDDYPTLLSRTELAIKEFKERGQKKSEGEEAEEEEENRQQETEDTEVKNPPPSPATDGRENSDNDDLLNKNTSNNYNNELFTLNQDKMDIV